MKAVKKRTNWKKEYFGLKDNHYNISKDNIAIIGWLGKKILITSFYFGLGVLIPALYFTYPNEVGWVLFLILEMIILFKMFDTWRDKE